MQERRCWALAHTPIAVGRARHHAFEERQDAAHALDLVESRDEMHFRRARVGETDVHPATNQCAYQAFCSIHAFHSFS